MTTSRKPRRKSNITAFVDQEHNKETTSAGQNEDLSGTFAPLQHHSSQAQAYSGFGNESFFNRIGGMDGIMIGMTNIQKIYSAYKLIQPMFNLLGSFGPTLQIKSIQHQRKRVAAASGKGRKETAGRKHKS